MLISCDVLLPIVSQIPSPSPPPFPLPNNTKTPLLDPEAVANRSIFVRQFVLSSLQEFSHKQNFL